MPTYQLVNLQGGVVVGDTAATPNSAAIRDSSGNLAAVAISGSAIASTGILSLAPTTKTTSTTVDATATFWNGDATGGAITFTLPAAASCANRVYVFKKVDASGNNVVIDGNASETIDGATTKTISSQYGVFRIWCDGTTWWTW